MKHLHVLAQPASPKGVCQYQLLNMALGLSLNNPQSTFGHLPKFFAQTARHQDLRLMQRYPFKMRL